MKSFVLLAAVAVLACTVQAGPPITVKGLSGANEVPPTASNVTGSFTAKLVGTQVTWTLTLMNAADFALRAAHVHLGNATTNGPIIIGMLATTATTGITALTGSKTIITSTVNATEGWTTVFNNVKNKTAMYVNVHSARLPGGEIRAQVPIKA